MSTLRRRGAHLFLGAVAFISALALFLGLFVWNGRRYVSVDLGEEYFFLVRDCEETTASAVAGQVYFSGGAGYLLDGGNAVVLACYFTKRDAEFVQRTMSEKGIETRIEERSPKRFSLSAKMTSEAARVTANADTADTCARILYDTANGLERTELTQEEARAAVKGVVQSLKGLREANEGKGYELWNVLLSRAERRGKEIASGILFAKDLRYLQVELCLAVAEAEGYFS